MSKVFWESILNELGLGISYMDIGIMTVKILIITLVAFILGIDREHKQKPVGVRTLVIIGVTSCILTIISLESAEKFMNMATSGAIPDPMRLPAQIVSGVGFLGAGVIFVRRNREVSGLTTAALVWGVANLGIAVGAGYFWLVLIGMIVILITLEGSQFILDRVGLDKKKKVFLSIYLNSDNYLTETLSFIKKKGMRIKDVSIKKEDELYILSLVVDISETVYVTDIYKYLMEQEDVVEVEVKQ